MIFDLSLSATIRSTVGISGLVRPSGDIYCVFWVFTPNQCSQRCANHKDWIWISSHFFRCQWFTWLQVSLSTLLKHMCHYIYKLPFNYQAPMWPPSRWSWFLLDLLPQQLWKIWIGKWASRPPFSLVVLWVRICSELKVTMCFFAKCGLYALGFASCLWILFGCKNDIMFVQYEVFGVAALIGAGGSTMLITRHDMMLFITWRWCWCLFNSTVLALQQS